MLAHFREFAQWGAFIHIEMDATRSDVDNLLRYHASDDPAVIEAMVQDYRAQVYRLALSITNDVQEAEDATQDTFIRAAFSLDRYQVGTNFRAWLLTIAVNTCRGYLRKRAARETLNRVLAAILATTSSQTGPEAAAVRNETHAKVWDLVDRLGEKHRLVVILRIAHGLSVQEISQILEIKEKTVYSRLYDAIQKLRKQARRLPEYEHLLDEFTP